MAKRIHRFFVPILFVLLIFGIGGLFLHSISAEFYPQSVSDVIATGKSQLFSRNVSKTLQAYQTFQAAVGGADYNTATNAEKIKLRVYLAAARMFDIVAREDGGEIDTLAEILSQYGVEHTGDAFDEILFGFPLNNNDKIILPDTAPDSADALKAFFAGPFLTAINASIADLDEAIRFCPASGQGIDVEIIDKNLIDPDDFYQTDVEMDAGDYWLFRSLLKFLKAYALMSAGYNTAIDIREIVSLVNMEAGMDAIKKLLDRYPDFLKISDNAKLNEARLALIDAINDYETASAKIRGDTSTQSDAEELISLDDDYEEALLRENLAKIKTSLQEQTTADLVTERIGTEYLVYGGDSFTVTEDEWWKKGCHPEQYGYTYLGKASNTATFSGSWDYYIITTKPGNMAPVDAVQGSDGTYLGTNITRNTNSWWNIGGAPDSSYALIGGESDGDGDGFVVIHPSAPINSLTVYLANVENVAREEHFQLNPFPLFGNITTQPKALRDMLPQIGEHGCFVPGTIGHGLGNDPTLGGILPDFTTQSMWMEEMDDFFQPGGDVTIATGAINVQDQGVSDWSGIAPVFTDITGETGDEPYRDIQSLYLAKDSTNLYIRIDTAGNIPTTNLYNWLGYSVFLKQLAGGQYEMPNDLKIRVFYNWSPAQWMAELSKVDSYGKPVFVATLNSTDFQLVENHLEIKIPLAQLGPLGGRFVSVSSEGWYGQDDNYTCLQIQPTAAVSGTLNVPGYDGSGPVYVEVFDYASFRYPNPKNRIGSQAIFPDAAGHLPAYSIANLPIGKEVFVRVFWDRDKNGVVTPGDYTGSSEPFTTVGGTNTQNLTVGDEKPAYPAPQFAETAVRHTMVGTMSAISMFASLTGPSPSDVAVTVTGPAGEYRLSPNWWVANKYGLFYGAQTSCWMPQSGDYTFTAVDSLGRKAQKTFHFNPRYDLPNITELTPADNAYVGTATPTLSWTPPAGGPYAYQVIISDYSNSSVIRFISPVITSSSLTVPAGILQANCAYRWYVRLFDDAATPTNYTQSAHRSLYTGAYASTPGFDKYIKIGTIPPSGPNPYYQHLFEAILTGVAPWDITGWRLKKGATTLIQSSQAPFFNPRGNWTFLIGSFQSTSPLSDGNDYAVELDINHSGTTSTISKTGLSYHFQDVETVDPASMHPGNNHYFKTATPTFSWDPVADSNTYYRLRIYSYSSNYQASAHVYSSPWAKNISSATVPPSILKRGRNYMWTVMTSPTDILHDPPEASYTIAYVNNAFSSRVFNLFTVQPPEKGDVSNDGDVDLEDALLALQIVSGTKPADALDGDVNADNRIDLREALYILQKISGQR